MIVRGLPLPSELVALVEAGRWRCPDDPFGLDRLFPDRGEFCCYSYPGMAGETWTLDCERTPMWHGTPDPGRPPGDIDPGRAVFIADLGIGYDQPIALDYRPSATAPRVVTLSWERPASPVPWDDIGPWREGRRTYDRETTRRLRAWVTTTEAGGWNRWVQVAPDFVTFAAMIGLPVCDIRPDGFGPPAGPPATDPAWLTSTAVSLARQMYESRDFAAMPILADALQDAGCDNADILGHCRGPRPHVRGCWVIGLVLGNR